MDKIKMGALCLGLESSLPSLHGVLGSLVWVKTSLLTAGGWTE